MEYYVYQEKDASDEDLQAGHQVNYSSSENSDSKNKQFRTSKRSSLKPPDVKEPKQAAQRYKSLVDENHRKNSRIWLGSNSILRVPKGMRKGEAVSAEENLAEKKRSQSEEPNGEHTGSDADLYGASITPKEGPGEADEVQLKTIKNSLDTSVTNAAQADGVQIRVDDADSPKTPEAKAADAFEASGAARGNQIQDDEDVHTQEYGVICDKPRNQGQGLHGTDQTEKAGASAEKKSGELVGPGQKAEMKEEDAGAFDVAHHQSKRSLDQVEAPRATLPATMSKKSTSQHQDSIIDLRRLDDRENGGDATPYLGSAADDKSVASSSHRGRSPDSVSKKSKPQEENPQMSASTPKPEAAATPFQTKRSSNKPPEREIADTEIKIPAVVEEDQNRNQLQTSESVDQAKSRQVTFSQQSEDDNVKPQKEKFQEKCPSQPSIRPKEAASLKKTDHLVPPQVAQVHVPKVVQAVKTGQVEAYQRLDPYESYNDESSCGTQQTCRVESKKDAAAAQLEGCIRVEKRRPKRNGEQVSQANQSLATSTNLRKQSSVFQTIVPRHSFGGGGATALDKPFGLESRPEKSGTMKALDEATVGSIDCEELNENLQNGTKSLSGATVGRVEELGQAAAREEGQSITDGNQWSQSSHTVLSRRAYAPAGIASGKKAEDIDDDSLSGRQNCETDRAAGHASGFKNQSQSHVAMPSSAASIQSLGAQTELTVQKSNGVTQGVAEDRAYDEAPSKPRHRMPDSKKEAAKSTLLIGGGSEAEKLLTGQGSLQAQRSAFLAPARAPKPQKSVTEMTRGNIGTTSSLAARVAAPALQIQGPVISKELVNQESQTSVRADSQKPVAPGRAVKLNASSRPSSGLKRDSSRKDKAAVVVHSGALELKERNAGAQPRASRQERSKPAAANRQATAGGKSRARARRQKNAAANQNGHILEVDRLSPEASGHVLSQVALCSSSANVNEADLISSQDPTQNDYLADESGAEAQAEKQRSVFVELYLKQESQSEGSLDPTVHLATDRPQPAGPGKQTILEARIIQEARLAGQPGLRSRSKLVPIMPMGKGDGIPLGRKDTSPASAVGAASGPVAHVSQSSQKSITDPIGPCIELILDQVIARVGNQPSPQPSAAALQQPERGSSQQLKVSTGGDDQDANEVTFQEPLQDQQSLGYPPLLQSSIEQIEGAGPHDMSFRTPVVVVDQAQMIPAASEKSQAVGHQATPVAALPAGRGEDDAEVEVGSPRNGCGAQQSLGPYQSNPYQQDHQDSIMSTYRSGLQQTQCPILTIEANIRRELGSPRLPLAGQGTISESRGQASLQSQEVRPAAQLEAPDGQKRARAASGQADPSQKELPDIQESQPSIQESQAQVHSTGRFRPDDYIANVPREDPANIPRRSSRHSESAGREQGSSQGPSQGALSPRARVAGDAVRLEDHISPEDQRSQRLGRVYQQQLAEMDAVPAIQVKSSPAHQVSPGIGLKQPKGQEDHGRSGKSTSIRLAPRLDSKQVSPRVQATLPLPNPTHPIVPGMFRHTGGVPVRLSSVEPTQNPNASEIGRSEFVRKFKMIRESREAANLSADQSYNDPVVIAADFDLKAFMERNQIPIPFQRQHHPGPPLGLAIHDFHKQNRERGGWKNKGPRDLSNESMNRRGQGHGPGNLARDRMVTEAMEETRQLLARSLEPTRDYLPASNARGAVPGGDTIAHGGLDFDDLRGSQIAFQKAVRNGQIDINHVYSLVQYIRRAHREPVLTDAEVEAHLQRTSHNSALGPRESHQKQLLEFKWHELIRFTHRNPQILRQLLQVHGVSAGADNTARQSDQFFTRRPRYTEKILQQIFHGLPGLIGHLHNSSVQGGGGHAPLVQPFAAAKPRRQLRPIVKNQPNELQVVPQQKQNSKRGTARNKQQSLGQPPRVQSRLEKSSFSPVVNSKRGGHLRKTGALPKVAGANHQGAIRGSFSSLNPGAVSQVARSMHVASAETTSQSDRPYLAASQPADSHPYGGPAYHAKGQAKQLRTVGHRDGQGTNDAIINIEIPRQRHERGSEPARHPVVGGKGISEHGSQIETGEAALRYASQFNVNLGQEAITSYDDGTGQSQNCPQGHEMKMMLASVDLKKPKTNERQRRKQRTTFLEPTQIVNSHSVNAQPHDAFGKNATMPDTESRLPSLDDQKSPIETITDQNLHQEKHWETRPKHARIARAPNADQRTELTSGGSVLHSRFEELANQRRALEAEEEELGIQRKAIVAEKDKVTRQLRRLDRRQELLEQEEIVKKQRMILEIEKKTLREDIGELDQLKEMLEQRKKDTNTGFSELAESNKELRSLKSGDLHRERSLMLSKQSGRSKILGSKVDSGQPIGTNTEENFASKHLKSSLTAGLQYPVQRDGNRPLQAPQAWDKEPSPAKFEAVHDPSRTAAEADGAGTFDSNQRSRSRTLEHSGAGARDPAEGQSKPSTKDHDARLQSSDSKDSGRNSQRSRRVSSQQRSRKSLDEAYPPAEELSQFPPNSLAPSMAHSLNHKPHAGSQVGQRTLVAGSPISQSNMTFLSGTGVFDWAQSGLMEDVLNHRPKFGPNQDINAPVDAPARSVFEEDEVFELIEQIKSSQKTLRDPAKLDTVFHKALDTLQELMICMNQTILFQMIAKKYTEVNMDNTVKLLVRCKQLLQSRQLAFKTLDGIVTFENSTQQIRRDVDAFLEASPREDLMKDITKQAKEDLPKLVQEVVGNIVELRDQYKLFSKMGATTSKGNQVLNVMAYKRRDAMRYILREYEGVKKLVQVVDVHLPSLTMQ